MSQQNHMKHWIVWLLVVLALTALTIPMTQAQAQPQKPNILVIMGDDIGWFNLSIYHGGMMGYQTPNIDRIAREGAMFTDWYGQQSRTTGSWLQGRNAGGPSRHREGQALQS